MNRVLHVDDEPDILEVSRLALEIVGGLTVEQACSAKEALKLLERFRPDLILLDVMMPEIDGPTLLTLLRQDPRWGSIPVVFMSAKVQTQEVRQYLAKGAAGVIPKPFDPMTLAAELKELWAHSAVTA